jgi:hypothetical protein
MARPASHGVRTEVMRELARPLSRCKVPLRQSAGRVAKEFVEDAESSWWDGFFGEEVGADLEGGLDGVDTNEGGEGAEVVNVSGTAGEGLMAKVVG